MKSFSPVLVLCGVFFASTFAHADPATVALSANDSSNVIRILGGGAGAPILFSLQSNSGAQTQDAVGSFSTGDGAFTVDCAGSYYGPSSVYLNSQCKISFDLAKSQEAFTAFAPGHVANSVVITLKDDLSGRKIADALNRQSRILGYGSGYSSTEKRTYVSAMGRTVSVSVFSISCAMDTSHGLPMNQAPCVIQVNP